MNACAVTKDTIDALLHSLGKSAGVTKPQSLQHLKELAGEQVEKDMEKGGQGEETREGRSEEGRSEEGRSEEERSEEERSDEGEAMGEDRQREMVEEGRSKEEASQEKEEFQCAKGKCKIKSEEEEEEQVEVEEEEEQQKKQQCITINLIEEELLAQLHSEPMVCEYEKGDTEQQCCLAVKLLGLLDSELGMYIISAFHVHQVNK
jgi:hypothetical protein